MLNVDVSVTSAVWSTALPDAEAQATAAVRAALAGTGRVLPEPAELSVTLADDAAVRRLNGEWRAIDRPTNVLSFPSGELDVETPRPAGMPVHLGDVVLAVETLQAEAASAGKPLAAHLRHLVVHGVLHLLGYDHATDGEAAAMEGLEARVLAGLGDPDPYAELPAEAGR